MVLNGNGKSVISFNLQRKVVKIKVNQILHQILSFHLESSNTRKPLKYSVAAGLDYNFPRPFLLDW